MQARTVVRNPGLEGMIRREGLHELQMRVAQIKMREPHGPFVHDLAVEEGQAELIAPDFQRGVRVRHCDGEVVKSLMFHGWFADLNLNPLPAAFARRSSSSWMRFELSRNFCSLAASTAGGLVPSLAMSFRLTP